MNRMKLTVRTENLYDNLEDGEVPYVDGYTWPQTANWDQFEIDDLNNMEYLGKVTLHVFLDKNDKEVLIDDHQLNVEEEELNTVRSIISKNDYFYCGNCGGAKDYCRTIQHCCSECTHSLI